MGNVNIGMSPLKKGDIICEGDVFIEYGRHFPPAPEVIGERWNGDGRLYRPIPKPDLLEQRRIMFMETAEEELIGALEEHGDFNSAHEGYAVLLEEVRELEAEVFKKRADRCGQRMYEECVQVAATAAKLAITIAENIPAKEEKSHGA